MDSQIVGFPYSEDPNKVPLISKTPARPPFFWVGDCMLQLFMALGHRRPSLTSGDGAPTLSDCNLWRILFRHCEKKVQREMSR